MLIVFGLGVLATLIGFAAASDWKSVLGVSLAGFWAFVAGLVLYRREKQQVDGRWWSRMLVAGLAVRLLAAFLHLAIGLWFYRGEADFLSYHRSGTNVAERILQGELIVFHTSRSYDKLEFRLIEYLVGLSYLLVGPGLVGMVLLFAVVGFIGIYLFLRAFRLEFPYGKDTRLLALGLLFLPSLAFWGSYPGKDSWMLLFLGWLTYSFTRLLHKFHSGSLVGVVVSLVGLALLRWPVAGMAALAMGAVWLLRPWKSPAAILRPIELAAYPLVVVAVLAYMGSFFLPRPMGLMIDPLSYVEAATERSVLFHEGYAGGGSARRVEIVDKSVGGILRYLPKGAFAFLFRPMVFEAHHGLALAAALEAAFFLALIIWRWRSLVAAIRMGFSTPFIGFCAVIFIALTAMLALEINFGIIVRHRAMVLPFLLILMAVPSRRKARQDNLTAP